MQNSALGVVLATAHFADPLVAVPCAISATVHSCVGSLVAGAWRLKDEKKNTITTRVTKTSATRGGPARCACI